MNAIVLNSYNTFGYWFHNVANKMGRQINRVGYLRAAAELNRIGYTEEARKCLEQLKHL